MVRRRPRGAREAIIVFLVAVFAVAEAQPRSTRFLAKAEPAENATVVGNTSGNSTPANASGAFAENETNADNKSHLNLSANVTWTSWNATNATTSVNSTEAGATVANLTAFANVSAEVNASAKANASKNETNVSVASVNSSAVSAETPSQLGVANASSLANASSSGSAAEATSAEDNSSSAENAGSNASQEANVTNRSATNASAEGNGATIAGAEVSPTKHSKKSGKTNENASKTTKADSAVCFDLPNWSDRTGESCKGYERWRYCTKNGEYGDGWEDWYGSFGDNANSEGFAATDACCACGGGNTAAPSNVSAGGKAKEASSDTAGSPVAGKQPVVSTSRGATTTAAASGLASAKGNAEETPSDDTDVNSHSSFIFATPVALLVLPAAVLALCCWRRHAKQDGTGYGHFSDAVSYGRSYDGL
eukprot:TRINITY_DN76441_c0_g1_i1.p1 TRINITY_DN76441_c0_g1~~TRINITY_DN76441_c0_g1_i1.p1  ORF type:complete len:443 (-),score=98.95 TRINITY_DN76441_c0_g1_i1:66-1334(-)